MSVYIKGMEMPKEGNWLSIRIYPDGTVGRPIGFGDYILAEDVEAIPVSLHGNLIERKAIGLTDFEIAMCNGDYKEGMKMLLEKIESAPTVIPAEEGE